MRSCDGPRSAMGRLLGTFAIGKVVVDRWDGGEGADAVNLKHLQTTGTHIMTAVLF